MTEWWNLLDLELQIFYAIGAIALGVTLIQMILSLTGFGGDGFDVDLDVSSADIRHPSGIGVFSAQTISAFFLGFGWVGAAIHKAGQPIWASVGGGALAGALGMAGMYWMIRGLLQLQSSGNLNYRTAIGSLATVYVTIPGDGLGGGGQIQVLLQGRLITASARRMGPGARSPGTRVRITGFETPNSFLVEPAGEPQASDS